MNDNTALISAARNLLSGTFNAVLATHSQEAPGFPFGSLIPYSIAHDGWPLMLLSHLAKHTKNIEGAPECNLTIIEPGTGDIQTHMRLSCLGEILPAEWLTTEARERHFRYFPQSRDYYEQLNFRFYHFVPLRFYWVGGFGAARWLGVDHLTYPSPFSLDQEAALVAALMKEHAERLANWLSLKPIAHDEEEPGKIVGVDGFGLDVRYGTDLLRLPFDEEISQTTDLNAAVLKTLAQ